ncbi:hypothetical protein ACFL3Q_14640 [Planctomycetota bacterium]
MGLFGSKQDRILENPALRQYLLHAITDVKKDVDTAFTKGGAMETFIEAKKQGRIRYLGFSTHSEGAALAAMERYDFDSILFPINFATFYKSSFGAKVIATAEAKGVARLALKALARQRWPKNDSSRKEYPKCWYQPLTERVPTVHMPAKKVREH